MLNCCFRFYFSFVLIIIIFLISKDIKILYLLSILKKWTSLRMSVCFRAWKNYLSTILFDSRNPRVWHPTKYDKLTIISDDVNSRFTWYKQVRYDLFSRSEPYQHLSSLFTNIWNELVRGKKYSQRWGYCVPRKKFSHANKQ